MGGSLEKGKSLCRGYYLCTFDIGSQPLLRSGVEAKIAAQIKAFNDAGLECEFMECRRSSSRLRRGLGSLPAVSDGIAWPKPEELGRLSFLYIRRPLYSSKEFIDFLLSVRRANPQVKIVMEVPTFPYDEELHVPEMFFALKKEKKYRRRWVQCIDRIADFSQHETIFEVPTLSISNGVDLTAISPRKSTRQMDGAIHAIFAASFGPWHGADLLIEGLRLYYAQGGSRMVFLHLAGGGSLIGDLRDQVARCGLKDHVDICGALSRNELDSLYDKCDIAFDSLALHRRGVDCLLSSSLKSREYLAKGIPSVYAGRIDVFEKEAPDFVLGLPSVEAPIDLNRVIEFYDALRSKEDDDSLIGRIRGFAEAHVAMDVAMGHVIEYLKGADSATRQS